MDKALTVRWVIIPAILLLMVSIGIEGVTEDPAQGEETMGQSMKLEVKAMADAVWIDNGVISLELGHGGVLRQLKTGEKILVNGNTAPLLTASILESEVYDGWRDYAPGQIVEANSKGTGHEYFQDETMFRAVYRGKLDFGSGDAIDYELNLTTSVGKPFLEASIRLATEGSFRRRFLRTLALRLPLALNKRKRVVQAGDRGVQWNTRHWYQFHVSPTRNLLREPDHNIWRQFAIDQNTQGDYHIWRSESTSTSSLSMQRGIQAPGWMAVYDQAGGLLLGYRGFAERAPKSLRVMAEGSGEALTYLWHSGLPVLDVTSPQANSVFGEVHTIDWLAFAGEFVASQHDTALAHHWKQAQLSSDPPARNEIALSDFSVPDASSADETTALVSGGVPIPRGLLKEPTKVRLRHAGLDVPVQTRALAYWPDQSIKWLLLTFPANDGHMDGATGEGNSLAFELTRRDGSRSQYQLDFGDQVSMGSPNTKLVATHQHSSACLPFLQSET